MRSSWATATIRHYELLLVRRSESYIVCISATYSKQYQSNPMRYNGSRPKATMSVSEQNYMLLYILKLFTLQLPIPAMSACQQILFPD